MWSSHPRHHISEVLLFLLPASLIYTIYGFVFATSLLSHSEKVAHSIANQLENIRCKHQEPGNPAGWLFRLFSCSDDGELASTQHQQTLLIVNRSWSACHTAERERTRRLKQVMSRVSLVLAEFFGGQCRAVHGGETITAAGTADTLTVLAVCQALCWVFCTRSPPRSLGSLQGAECSMVRASLRAPVSTRAAGVLMLLSPLPVLPPKWTVPLFIKKKSLFAYLAVSGLRCITWDLFIVALGLCSHGLWA